MNESLWLISCVALMLCGCLTMVVWRFLSTLRDMSAAAYRASDRERHDRDGLLARMVEHRDSPSPQTGQMHAGERIQQMRLDAACEQSAIQASRNHTPKPAEGFDQYGSEMESMFNG